MTGGFFRSKKKAPDEALAFLDGTEADGDGYSRRILDRREATVQFFFEEAPHVDGRATPGMAEGDSEAFILEFLNSREGLELNRAFVKISDPKVRESVVDLVRALSASADN